MRALLTVFVAAAAAVGIPAVALAQAPASGPKTVSPVIVIPPPPKDAPPADVTIPISSDQDATGVVVWPEGALQAGISGYVTLACEVDVHGLAETCRVAYENPQGRGFGKAALALRPTFLLTPKSGPDGPVDSTMRIALSFMAKPPNDSLQEVNSAAMGSMETTGRTIYLHNNPMVTRPLTMMTEPAWSAVPSYEAWAAAYPAEGGGVAGYAVAHCKVDAQGVLAKCQVAKEEPEGHGFGKAALGLAAKFRASPEAMARAPHGAPVEVDVPVRFPAPSDAKDRIVREPLWISGSDPQSLLRELPLSVATKPNSPGAIVQCKVGEGGALTGCEVEYTSPDGIDFDEAAVKIASRLRMNLWSGEASPVQGGVVHIPIRVAAPEQARR